MDVVVRVEVADRDSIARAHAVDDPLLVLAYASCSPAAQLLLY